jgi:hypothetical protein
MAYLTGSSPVVYANDLPLVRHRSDSNATYWWTFIFILSVPISRDARGAGENAYGIIREFLPKRGGNYRRHGFISPVSACSAIGPVLWSGARWQVKRGVAASGGHPPGPADQNLETSA